jgi:hypothetical protein
MAKIIMILNPKITDLQRCEFFQKLKASDLLLSEWEQNFMSSHFHSGGISWFTDGRRESTDKMWMRYGGEVRLPFPEDLVPDARPQIADADPAGCEFLMRLDGAAVQSRCNAPAELMRANGFRYCGPHADQVQRDLKRMGKKIHLMPFAPHPGPLPIAPRNAERGNVSQPQVSSGGVQ